MTMTYGALRSASQRIDLAGQSPLPCPMTIYVEATNVCNFKCRYCPESFDTYKDIAGGHHRMDAADFATICDQIGEMGRLKTLNFYMMGEPFVNRALPDFIAMARRRDVSERLVVTSNGTLIDEAMARRVIDSGLDYLRFSIYGLDQETFSAVTGSRMDVERVIGRIRAIRALRDAMGRTKPFLYAKMIDTRDAARNRRFLDLFGGLCDEAAIEPVMNWNDPGEGNLSGLDSADLLEGAYFARKKSVCAFPFYTLVIHSDLQVSVCCVDWAKKAVVGSLREQSLREIWTGERLHAFRMAHLRRERHTLAACGSCTFLHTAPDDLDALRPEVLDARRAPARPVAAE